MFQNFGSLISEFYFNRKTLGNIKIILDLILGSLEELKYAIKMNSTCVVEISMIFVVFDLQ